MKNILVAIDFSAVTDRVVTTAEQLARSFGAKIWLLHCVRDYPLFAAMEEVPLDIPGADPTLKDKYPEPHRHLSAILDSIKQKGIESQLLLTVGLPADEILFAVEQYDIDLILLGSHGHGAVYDLVVGSVANAVLMQSPVMTLIVPSKPRRTTIEA